jgi:hypothetical protein
MIKKLTPLLSGLIFCTLSFAQKQPSENLIVVPAGAEYKTGHFHRWLWGNNYRKIWATPITVPVAMLDTLAGGLIPEKSGGGNQTKSLHLLTKEGKKYTLRSVNKTLGKVLPKAFLGTFLEDMTNDKVSMSYPYAAPVVAYMAERVGIYHTNPVFVYLPKQPALDSFPQYGDQIYLFEQKLGGSWTEADNLGNFDKFESTVDLLKEMRKDNEIRVDQKLFVRSRLFDMLINDWDRHEDQWEWGYFKSGEDKIYQPVPKDRDQAFFTYNGVLLNTLMKASELKYFQPFKPKMTDVNWFNFEQRNLDRFFANEMTKKDWQNIARDMQQSLSDKVLEEAMLRLPKEVQNMSSKKFIKKLKGRRDMLVDNATKYYENIAKEVDIPGSEEREYFDVERLNDTETSVKVYRISKEGNKKDKPIYERVFVEDETKEIRLYGINGKDVFSVTGSGTNDTKIRLVGGFDYDSFYVAKHVEKVHLYDNKENVVEVSSKTREHYSDDSAIHAFKYASHHFDKRGVKPVIFFNNDDRLFVGMMYNTKIHKWRKEPYAHTQNLSLNYSISQKAFSVVYKGYYPGKVGKADLALSGNYDAVRWTNFFGLGNESQFAVKDIDFYRARTEEWHAGVGLIRKWKHSQLQFGTAFQNIRVIRDNDRFTGKVLANSDPMFYNVNRFGNAQLQYAIHDVDEPIVPAKGYSFMAGAGVNKNLENSNVVGRIISKLDVYIPLISKFSLGLHTGVETVSGNPEFYQYASLGGTQSMRAMRTGRYWGKTAFYSSNDLRFISNVKSYIYNGKLGLIGFFENGRVWLPGENSDNWHNGYGAGILFAPFDMINAEVTYGITNDEKLWQLKLGIPLK